MDRNNELKKRKHIEYSKKILTVSYIIAVALTTFCCYLTLTYRDASIISNIALACWVEVSVGNGFYYWKARSENKIKMMSSIEDREIRERINLEKDY